jgi:lipopolysaccharide assembly outer membrane protein LptD (OstA)
MVTTIFGLTFGVAGVTLLHTRAGAAPQGAKTSKQRVLDVTADSFTDVTKTGIRTLAGNVRIASDNTVMRTALAQYNTRTNIAVAPGTIRIEDERNTIIGNSGKAYYETRDAIIQGAVKIVVRPKPGNASAPEGSVRREFKDPVTVFCDRVDYSWRTRIAVATGNLTLKQNTSDGITRTVTAKRLTFYSREERLILDGDVNAVDSKGQKLKGPQATAIIREGAEEFRMEKGATAEIIIEDEDEDAPASGTPPLLPAPVASPPVPSGSPETLPTQAPAVPGASPRVSPSTPKVNPLP